MPVDAFVERPANPLQRFSALFTLLILFAISAFFSIQEGRKFLDFGNFENIALNAAQLLLLTVGVTFVIITAGIDLSIGSVLVFSAVSAALVMRRLAGSPAEVELQQFPDQGFAIPIGLAVGVLSG